MAGLEDKLIDILSSYKESFSEKNYTDEFYDTDPLMNVFGITQELKRENKQYWGRELGKCWEVLVRTLFELTCKDFEPPKRVKRDEPVDFYVGYDAVDTKYRIGSGDSGTLKKFTAYGKMMKKQGYNPVILLLRTDNLPAALSKIDAGGWTRLESDAAFDYIREKTNFELKEWLIYLEKENKLKINR